MICFGAHQVGVKTFLLSYCVSTLRQLQRDSFEETYLRHRLGLVHIPLRSSKMHLFQGHQRHKKREEHVAPQSCESDQRLRPVGRYAVDRLLLRRQIQEPTVQLESDE